jgi:protease I
MKALLIIAPSRFRDEEYFHTKEELEKAKIGTVTASKTTDVSVGMLGGKVKPGKTLNEVDVNAYDAIVFIGGGGSQVYFDDQSALNIAKRAESAGKIVAALCIAPSILANAGILRGRKATAFPSEEMNMRAKGADFTGASLTVDGKIITANGPAAAKDFGKAIAHALGR